MRDAMKAAESEPAKTMAPETPMKKRQQICSAQAKNSASKQTLTQRRLIVHHGGE